MELKWYDNVVCGWFGFVLATNLLHLNLLGLALNIMAFYIYKDWRHQK